MGKVISIYPNVPLIYKNAEQSGDQAIEAEIDPRQ